MFGFLVIAFVLILPKPVEHPRVAIIDLQGDEESRVTSLFENVVRDFDLVDRELTRRAIRGAMYTGSLNLSKEEARSLGESIGCDYYLTGVVRNMRRLASGGEAYFEAVAGIYVIETRTGRLVRFECVRERSGSEGPAFNALVVALNTWAVGLKDLIERAYLRIREVALEPPRAAALDVVDLEGGGSSKGLTPPIFYDRLKPVYTEIAASIDLIATVEVSAVFGAGGRVEESEIVRWAGFGLDESALATVRRLRFKSAMKNGAPVSVRGLVRYNFRRPPPEDERDAAAKKLKESIRSITKSP